MNISSFQHSLCSIPRGWPSHKAALLRLCLVSVSLPLARVHAKLLKLSWQLYSVLHRVRERSFYKMYKKSSMIQTLSTFSVTNLDCYGLLHGNKILSKEIVVWRIVSECRVCTLGSPDGKVGACAGQLGAQQLQSIDLPAMQTTRLCENVCQKITSRDFRFFSRKKLQEKSARGSINDERMVINPWGKKDARQRAHQLHWMSRINPNLPEAAPSATPGSIIHGIWEGIKGTTLKWSTPEFYFWDHS